MLPGVSDVGLITTACNSQLFISFHCVYYHTYIRASVGELAEAWHPWTAPPSMSLGSVYRPLITVIASVDRPLINYYGAAFLLQHAGSTLLTPCSFLALLNFGLETIHMAAARHVHMPS